MKITFIVNSLYFSEISFRKKVLDQLSLLPNKGIDYLFTEEKGDSIYLTRKAIDSGSTLIIGCGGDGTLHEILNGCLTSERLDNNSVIIGQFPAGTGNDFSRNFKLSKNPSNLSRRLHSLCLRKIDIGQLTLADGSSVYFHNEVSFGFGAEVIRKMEISKGDRKKSYFKSIIQAFNSYHSTPVKITGDNFQWEGKAFMIVVANGRYMGGGLSIAPEASPFSGSFHITIIGEVSMWEYFTQLPYILQSKKLKHRSVYYFEAKELEIHWRREIESGKYGDIPMFWDYENRSGQFASLVRPKEFRGTQQAPSLESLGKDFSELRKQFGVP